eukprot:gene20643-40480_t
MEAMKSRSLSGGLVYSTDAGRMCPACRQAMAQCACKASPPAAPGDGIVRISRETKGRGGKAVTLVKGVLVDGAALEQLGKQLKAACGSGGTVKDGVIEVQGDHVERVMQLLQAQGHKPEDLQKLVERAMPFGKYQGRLIADLPGDYLNWFAREGFPKSEIGRLLQLMHEIDHNGLSDLLTPLRSGTSRKVPGARSSSVYGPMA